MQLCIDAAPLNRSLGYGMNWMIREIMRFGLYDNGDLDFMAPYCWAPSQRIRELLKPLGLDIASGAGKDDSRAIYEFVVRNIGVDRAHFKGEFDLPLQQITRNKYSDALVDCYKTTNRDHPIFRDLAGDELPFGVIGT